MVIPLLGRLPASQSATEVVTPMTAVVAASPVVLLRLAVISNPTRFIPDGTVTVLGDGKVSLAQEPVDPTASPQVIVNSIPSVGAFSPRLMVNGKVSPSAILAAGADMLYRFPSRVGVPVSKAQSLSTRLLMPSCLVRTRTR